MNIWDRIHYEPMPWMPFEVVNLADVQAFDVSDVLSFWCRHEESGSEWQTMSKTFPNVAPPFQHYFMFGRRPQEFRRETVLKEYDGTRAEVGVLFFANRDDASGHVGNLHAELLDDAIRFCVGRRPQHRTQFRLARGRVALLRL